MLLKMTLLEIQMVMVQHTCILSKECFIGCLIIYLKIIMVILIAIL